MRLETIERIVKDSVAAAAPWTVVRTEYEQRNVFGVLRERCVVVVTTPPPKRNYDCLAKLKPDEPYFVLRAQDVLAPKSVRDWGARLCVHSPGNQKAGEAFELAGRMDAWQALNTCKVPD